jgi:hypothetical protein
MLEWLAHLYLSRLYQSRYWGPVTEWAADCLRERGWINPDMGRAHGEQCLGQLRADY